MIPEPCLCGCEDCEQCHPEEFEIDPRELAKLEDEAAFGKWERTHD